MDDNDLGRPFGQPATHEPSLASRLGPSDECQAQGGRERPSQHGAILGEAIADLAKAGGVGTVLLSAMCATCAFREGCMTNQMAATGLLALNCAIGVDPDAFACHHGMKDGEPTRLCAGYAAARLAPFEAMKATLATMKARLENLPEHDAVRAGFDAWAAIHDPDGTLDDYKRSRLYTLASADTHPQGGDGEAAPFMSGAVAKPDAPTPAALSPLIGK